MVWVGLLLHSPTISPILPNNPVSTLISAANLVYKSSQTMAPFLIKPAMLVLAKFIAHAIAALHLLGHLVK